MTRSLFAAAALLPTGWARDVLVRWDDAGVIRDVRAGTAPPVDAERAAGPLLPGMPNCHSHAFQRAFAGLTEYRGDEADSFWTWRDRMYRVALAISPEQLERIATLVYVEMLQAGYTSVCEFQYLHHDPDGHPYAEPAELSLRLVAAARRAGIGLTMLPVLYRHAGFGSQPPRAQQRRFLNEADGLLRIVERLRREAGVRVGVAPHSLRAVAPEDLRALLAGLDAIDASAPIHLHIAEQTLEIEDCLAWSGRRPVRWLLDEAPVDARWCLVHATHVDDGEAADAARRGAVAGLCPTTEANLGDGIFPASAYLAAGGRWAIGSDSHVVLDVAEELRLLETGQRLCLGQRNVLGSDAHPHVAEALWLAAVAGGAQAAGRPIAGIAVGQRADLVVIDDPVFEGLSPSQALGTTVFSRSPRQAVRDVWVGGTRRVENHTHAHGEDAMRAFVAARNQLLSELG